MQSKFCAQDFAVCVLYGGWAGANEQSETDSVYSCLTLVPLDMTFITHAFVGNMEEPTFVSTKKFHSISETAMWIFTAFLNHSNRTFALPISLLSAVLVTVDTMFVIGKSKRYP